MKVAARFFLKASIGVALLPVLVGFLWAAADVIGASLRLTESMVACLAGGTLLLLVVRLFPKPWRTYVAGHELTHATWAWLFGHKVKSIKVGATGGHVVLSDTNSLVTLAPYFFPLYAVAWAALAAVVEKVWPPAGNWLPLPAGFGFFYAFHVAMTLQVLRLRQPDIVSEGAIFSALVILVGNLVVGLLAGPQLAGSGSFLDGIHTGWFRTGQTLEFLVRLPDRFNLPTAAP
jgi:hypothetical protein